MLYSLRILLRKTSYLSVGSVLPEHLPVHLVITDPQCLTASAMCVDVRSSVLATIALYRLLSWPLQYFKTILGLMWRKISRSLGHYRNCLNTLYELAMSFSMFLVLLHERTFAELSHEKRSTTKIIPWCWFTLRHKMTQVSNGGIIRPVPLKFQSYW